LRNTRFSGLSIPESIRSIHFLNKLVLNPYSGNRRALLYQNCSMDFFSQATAANHMFGTEACSNDCKSEHVDRSAGASPLCPQCGSKKLWRDGLRYSVFGDRIQRLYCRKCGFRFSDPDDVQKGWNTFERTERVDTKTRKATGDLVSSRQICVTETKNLAAEQKEIEVPRRSEADVKGMLVKYTFWMEKQGYDPETIRGWLSCLRALLSENADLQDPESVKEVLAKDAPRLALKKKPRWGQYRRQNIINAYKLFMRINKMQVWDKWGKTQEQDNQEIPVHPNRAGNRRPNSWIRKAECRIRTAHQRICDATRRSKDSRVDKHRLRTQRHNAQPARKRLQPKNVESPPKTHQHAQCHTKNVRTRLPDLPKIHENNLEQNAQTTRREPSKPATKENQLLHTATLESHDGIPPHKRHSLRAAAPRPQRRKEHHDIHKRRTRHIRRRRKRRVHRKSHR